MTCPLYERIVAALHAGDRPARFVATKAEVEALAVYLAGRQTAVGDIEPYPRRPLTMFGRPVVKEDGSPWVISVKPVAFVPAMVVIE